MEDFGDTIGDNNNNEILNNNYIGNNTNDDNDEAGRIAVFCWTLTCKLTHRRCLPEHTHRK